MLFESTIAKLFGSNRKAERAHEKLIKQGAKRHGISCSAYEERLRHARERDAQQAAALVNEVRQACAVEAAERQRKAADLNAMYRRLETLRA